MIMSTVNNSKRKRDDEESEVRDAPRRISVFTCKTCSKEFSTFQALGGHRASHSYRNPNSMVAYMAPGKVLKEEHECGTCHEKFETGQALGGHMRKHRSKITQEKLGKDEASKVSSPKSDLTCENSVGDKSKCNSSALVMRDFFETEPILNATLAEVAPLPESADSWLDLKLAPPCGDFN